MSKLQIGIAALAALLVFLLFLLPKGIIKKEKEISEKSRPMQQEAVVPAEVHKAKASISDEKKIKELTKEFFAVSNTEKKIKFADSLAVIYRKFHQYDSAARYTEEVARLNPTTLSYEKAGDAYNMAYTVASEDQKPVLNEKSRSFYKLVLGKSPGNLEVKSKLALTFIGTENPMEGILMLREILKTDPENETAIYNLGILSMQSGQYQKAIDRFKQLIDINPVNANAHFYLGMSFMNAGEKKKAKIAFEAARALENDPAFQATVETYLKELEQDSQ
jgi:tetratricopeptide (TPR) repeat protein